LYQSTQLVRIRSMGQESSGGKLVERLLSLRRRAVLLCGPAGSGKTATALALYRACLDEAGTPHCLLIVPNAFSAKLTRRQLLLDTPHGVLLSPAVMTFSAVASRIVGACGEPRRCIPTARRRLMLRRIVDRLNCEGKLSRLGAVCDTHGLISSLDKAIHELKRAAVEPDALSKAIGTRPGKNRDLLEIYREYQRQLHETRSYDTEGLIWQARDLLRDTRQLPTSLAAFHTIVVDGFTDFTPTQLEILDLLGRRIERIVVTLPFATDGRDRMWRWTRRTRDRIKARFVERLERIDLPSSSQPAEPHPGSLLAEKLFDPDARIQPAPCVRIVQAAGMDAEVEAAARRVKRLLLDGAPAGSIAVLVRPLELYREPIERIFAAHDIPIASAPQPLLSVPVVRFALQAASLAPGFESNRVASVIRSSYFRPQVLGDFDGRTVACAESLIRQGNVLSGRESYIAAAERLSRDAGSPQDQSDDDQTPTARHLSNENIERARRMLEALFELCQAASDAKGLLGLIEKLDLHDAATASREPEMIGRDLRALDTLIATVDELTDLNPSIEQLSEALDAVRCPPRRGEALVDVIDVLDARPCRWDHVVLLGLGEGQFPQRFSDESLLGQADRARLARRGVLLDSREDLTAREMLLFYLAATRAQRSLTLSFPRWDESGQDKAPGAFVESLIEQMGGLEALSASGVLETIGPGRFAVDLAEVATPRQALLAATGGLFDASLQRRTSAALRWVSRKAPDVLQRTSVGIWVYRRRWSDADRDAYDGRLSDGALRGRLAERFGPEAVFSPSQFNCFGRCPWMFFARYVLKLEPLDEPQRRLDPVAIGAFCHDVLFRVMRALGQDRSEPLDLSQIQPDRIASVLDEAIESQSRTIEARNPVAHPQLWSIQREQWRRRLMDYLIQQRNDKLRSQPMHFELRFGRSKQDTDLCDPSSRDEPVVLETPAGPVRIAGRVDRVDLVESQGHRGLFVVDYKSGSLDTPADIAAGRSMQLPIYAEAVEQILGENCLGGAFHSLSQGKQVYFSDLHGSRNRGSYENRRRAACETVGRFVAAMREGRFDVLPTYKCGTRCPYRRICNFSEARNRIKQSEPAPEDQP